MMYKVGDKVAVPDKYAFGQLRLGTIKAVIVDRHSVYYTIEGHSRDYHEREIEFYESLRKELERKD